jgi:putative thioredoxin
MMASDYIIDVSEADFQYQVLEYSQKVPVLVDFWAEWCIPCRTLGPLLEQLTEEAQGAFRLAKLNVDQNQNLARQFNVRSIPSVKVFRNGRVQAEFTGAQQESKVREFLRAIAPSDVELTLEKAQSFMQLKQFKSAASTFQQVLEKMPKQPSALLGLIKCDIIQGDLVSALNILRSFPASQEFSHAQQLMPLAIALERNQDLREWSDNPLDAAYSRSLSLITRGNYPAAFDGLLDILREDKKYKNDKARQVVIAMFELLGEDNELTRQYRRELASVLF